MGKQQIIQRFYFYLEKNTLNSHSERSVEGDIALHARPDTHPRIYLIPTTRASCYQFMLLCCYAYWPDLNNQFYQRKPHVFYSDEKAAVTHTASNSLHYYHVQRVKQTVDVWLHEAQSQTWHTPSITASVCSYLYVVVHWSCVTYSSRAEWTVTNGRCRLESYCQTMKHIAVERFT